MVPVNSPLDIFNAGRLNEACWLVIAPSALTLLARHGLGASFCRKRAASSNKQCFFWLSLSCLDYVALARALARPGGGGEENSWFAPFSQRHN